jgi:hypothetical protein
VCSPVPSDLQTEATRTEGLMGSTTIGAAGPAAGTVATPRHDKFNRGAVGCEPMDGRN